MMRLMELMLGRLSAAQMPSDTNLTHHITVITDTTSRFVRRFVRAYVSVSRNGRLKELSSVAYSNISAMTKWEMVINGLFLYRYRH